jgi:hypothetical protein
MNLHIPSKYINIKDLPISPIRLGIIGVPGAGKTWSALSFPNPVYVDFDNKTKGWRSSNPDKTPPVLPFWNKDFVVNQLGIKNYRAPGQNTYTINKDEYTHNVRDAFKKWLTEEAVKLTPEQTLIIDSFSSLNDFFDIQSKLPWEIVYSPKTGQEDGFAFWGLKLKYNTEINTSLKNLSCNVVSLFHEMPEKDEEGRVLGIKPLIQGQSADRTPKDYTDFFRQKVFNKADSDCPKEITWFTDKGEAYTWVTVKSKYLQIACKSNEKYPALMEANYSSLIKTYA